MYTKTKPLPIVAPPATARSDLRRESIRRDLTLALTGQDDDVGRKNGFDPYDSGNGHARPDVWGSRRR